MFDGHLRTEVDKRTGPIGEALAKTPLTADSLTVAGIVFSIAAGVIVGFGHFLLGFVLVSLGAIPDLLDGPLAKVKGTASKRGAFFDSFSDRVSDLFLFGGLGWYFLRGSHPEQALLPFGVYGAASLISYQRAKAESLGFAAKGGLMERAERLIALGFGLLFSSIIIPVMWATLVLSVVTVVQRFSKIWNQASVKSVSTPRRYKRLSGSLAGNGVERSEFFRPRAYRASHPRRRSDSSSMAASISRWLEQKGSKSG